MRIGISLQVLDRGRFPCLLRATSRVVSPMRLHRPRRRLLLLCQGAHSCRSLSFALIPCDDPEISVIMQRFGDHNGEECELGGRTDGPNDRNRRTDFEQSCAPSLSGASSAVPSASAGYAAQPALSIARNGEVSRAASYPCR